MQCVKTDKYADDKLGTNWTFPIFPARRVHAKEGQSGDGQSGADGTFTISLRVMHMPSKQGHQKVARLVQAKA